MRALARVTLAVAAVAFGACGIDAVGALVEEAGVTNTPAGDSGADPVEDEDGTDGGNGGGGDASGDGTIIPGDADGGGAPLVQYMHSATSLYRVRDTDGLTTLVASFGGACAGINVGDLAVDKTGKAYVATLPPSNADGNLYSVNLTTGVCGAAIGTLGRRCNALTFAPDPADATKEVLFAACTTAFYRVSTTTAATTLVGALGTNLSSSGDIVWMPGRGVFITLADTSSTNDRLGSVNLTTGAATPIGTNVGRIGVYALGYLGGKIFGYGDGYSITIDPTTGAGATWNASTGIYAYGAASGP